MKVVQQGVNEIETWGPTMALRWRQVLLTARDPDGFATERVLEQAYQERATGKIEWRPVPLVE
jgi:hypothetical protein